MKWTIDREELRRLYHEERLSLSILSDRLGVHAVTIRNRMVELKIPRRSISESLLRRKHTWGKKIAKRLVGRRHSAEARKKMSLAATGRKSPLRGLFKVTHPHLVKAGVAGKRHWNWKGGISAINVRIRQSSLYKCWRASVFRRDNWTCVRCGTRGGRLEADHIKSFAKYPSRRFAISNGRTLCETCHAVRTSRQRRRRKKIKLHS